MTSMPISFKPLAFAFATVLLLGSIGRAQLIGIQTYATNGPTSVALTTGQTAGVISQSNFNTMVAPSGDTSTSGTISNLKDSEGVLTGIGFTATGNDNYGSGTGTSTANATLLSGQSGVYQITATYTFTNVPFGLYNLVVYTEGNGGGPAFTAEVQLATGTTPGSSTYWDLEQYGPNFTGSFIRGTATTQAAATTANYVEFLNVAPVSVSGVNTIQVQVPLNGPDAFVGINGFQLEAVPEPSVTALMCAGIAGLFFVMVRRKTTMTIG